MAKRTFYQATSKFIAAFMIVLLTLAALPISPAYAADTGLRSPTGNVNGGGGNGWTNPQNAYTSNNVRASAGNGDFVNYINFGFNGLIPATDVIDGIEVLIEGYTTGRDATVDLSWNNGSGYTTGDPIANFTNVEQIIIVGDETSTWGRTWSPGEFNNATFRVRLTAAGGGGTLYVDHIQVRVYHHTPVTYTINASSGSGGTITPSGNIAVIDGSNQVFDITPNSTYVVSDVQVDAASQGRLNAYTFTNVTSDHNIAASFDGGWTAPTANGAGGWTNEANAYISDGSYAVADGSNDIVDYYNFGLSIPNGVTVTGVAVAIEGYASGTREAEVTLSWNNGANYTAVKTTAMPNGGSEATYILGSATDTWGRTWTDSDFSNANFRVRLDATFATGSLYVDQVQVKVYYTLDQTITFGALGDKTYGDPDFTVSASATSGLAVSFSSQTPATCGVIGDTVSILSAGTCTIRASQAGNATYNPAPDVDQSFTIDKATPTVSWSNPADITYGTALSGVQLNATASIPGTFTYTPVAGTLLSAGSGQILSVDFVPTDSANYNSVLATTVTINVLKATPSVSWSNPADITYGTALSSTQLNATASVPGTFTYNPTAGTVLNAGSGQVLSVDFVPTDTTNYNDVIGTTVTIDVLSATATVTLGDLSHLYNGTPRSATATTNPNGLTVDITYDGSPTAPTDAGSYTVVGTVNDPNYVGSATDTLVITPATVDPAITASDKIYDGTTAATIASRTLTGIIGADDVNLSGGTATFTDKNVGAGKTVTATGLNLSGTQAGNYQLSTTTATAAADITIRTLNISANGVNKVYDGTTNATVTLSDDRIAGDDVATTYTNASFLDPDVGAGKTVNVSGISITGGADVGNYTLGNTTTTTTANITAAGQTITVTTSAPATAINGSSFDVAATVSSGLPVSITTSGVCTGNGDDLVTITMTNGTGTCTVHYNQAGNANFSAAIEITEAVSATEGPAITSASSAAFTVGSLSVFTITTSGNPAPTITHVSGALPSGIVFTGGVDTAALSGTPALGTAGTYTLEFQAENGILPNATQTFTLTIVGGPVVVTNGVNTNNDSGDGHIDEAEVIKVGVTQFFVTFSKDVNNAGGGAGTDDVTNPANYILVRDNGDGIQTSTCAPGGVSGNDFVVPIDSVEYNNNAGNGPFVVTLNVNGGSALPNGVYRLIVCGTTSIVDLADLPLAGDGTTEGTDYVLNFSIAIPTGGGGGGGGGGAGGLAGLIPVTGFTPGRVTDLSDLSVTSYHAANGATLEVPVLKLNLPIVGIPMKDKTWDVNWLLNQAGWLEGSAFPGFSGNSVLTSHVTLPYGQAGPFANLHKVKTGDKVFVRAFGNLYIYEVRSVDKLDATDPSILQHEDKSWLTLVTCADYSETAETYLKRLVVKAVLLQTQPERPRFDGR